MPDLPPGFDFSDPDLYARRVPAGEFAELRRTAPAWWNAQRRGASGYDDDGYWVVTRHADVMAASRDSGVFSSWENTAIIRYREGGTREDIENQRLIMLNVDPPDHTRLRGIVSRGFTPRAIASLRPALTARAEQIVRAALATGTGDFVTDVASELPLQAIAELIGVPPEDRRTIFAWSIQMTGNEDPEFADQASTATAELIGYAMAMAEERKARPRDDIVTRLVSAEADGALTAAEFGFFVVLLVAGATRPPATRSGLPRLPGPMGAVQGRTAGDHARRDRPLGHAVTVLGSQEIKQGQRVGLFYRSANFDEDVFDAAPTRTSATAPGRTTASISSLARLEIELIFNAIADAMPDIRRAGEPERLRSSYLNGIKKMPVTYC